MSDLDLDAIKARVAEAWYGPYYADRSEFSDGWCVHDGGKELAQNIDREVDAQFLAHARQDMPALVAEVERLRDKLAALKTAPARPDSETGAPLPPGVEGHPVSEWTSQDPGGADAPAGQNSHERCGEGGVS